MHRYSCRCNDKASAASLCAAWARGDEHFVVLKTHDTLSARTETSALKVEGKTEKYWGPWDRVGECGHVKGWEWGHVTVVHMSQA